MEEKISVGDVVLSTAGRDKDNLYLVISTDGKNARIVNGKARKTQKPKNKNVKHLKTVYPKALTELAENLNNGKPVGNERLRKKISAVNEKI